MNKIFLICLFLLNQNVFALTFSTPAELTDYKAVVQIIVPAYDNEGAEVNGYCNATLVSKDTLITAAHCVVSSYLFSNQPLKIEVGEYRYKQTPNGNIRIGYITNLRHSTPVTVQLAKGVSPTSAPNRIPPENDYAVLKLQTEIALPPDFKFPLIWNQALTTSMVSKAFVVSVNPIATISSNDTKQTATLNQIQFLGLSAKSTSNSRVEEGDSGAPLFVVVQGQTYLAGVVKGRATTAFSNWDVFAIWSDRIQP